VTDRDVEGLLIKTSKGASFSGVVILEGTDDPKVRASLLAGRIIARIADGYVGRSAPSANINPNGSFRINGLAAGRLTLHLETRERLSVIRLERNGMPQQGGVEIKEREQVTGLRVVVGKANGAIRGVVIRPAGFELPATARILLVVRKTGQDTGLPVGLDARGHFHIENLIPGTYDIRVMTVHGPPSQSPPLPTVRQTVEVTNGAETAVTITLQLPKPRPQ
jgi:hypothetical protein